MAIIHSLKSNICILLQMELWLEYIKLKITSVSTHSDLQDGAEFTKINWKFCLIHNSCLENKYILQFYRSLMSNHIQCCDQPHFFMTAKDLRDKLKVIVMSLQTKKKQGPPSMLSFVIN